MNIQSTIRVRGTTISLSKEIEIGIQDTFRMTEQPMFVTQISKLTSNVLWPGFFYVTDILIGNRRYHQGVTDGILYMENHRLLSRMKELGIDVGLFEGLIPPDGLKVDWPTIDPGMPISIEIRYSGLIPRGYKGGDPFRICMTAKGHEVY